MKANKLRVRLPYYLESEKERIEKAIVMMVGVVIRRIWDWGDELEFELVSRLPTWEVQMEVAKLASRLGLPYTIE